MQLLSQVAVAVMQAPAAALIQPLAQELPCASDIAIKRENNKNNGKNKIRIKKRIHSKKKKKIVGTLLLFPQLLADTSKSYGHQAQSSLFGL